MKMLKKMCSCISALCLATTLFGGLSLATANAATKIYGDVNNDGIVNATDVVTLNSFLQGKISPSSINTKYLDVDINVVLDVNDKKTIAQYIVNNISSLPYTESGSNFVYYANTFPADNTRNYVKYNCKTGTRSTYTLNKLSPVSTYAGDIDDREIDSSNNAQAIVHLNYKKGNNLKRASGFIVSDHVIATCAHCLYDADGKNFCTDYKVSVYNPEGTSIVTTYSAKELHIPQSYIDQNPSSLQYNNTYDYGLIYVEEDLSKYGNIALGLPTDNFRTTFQTVWVSGFPGDVNGTPTTSRYYASGEAILEGSQDSEYKIYTDTYISGGDSGGPAYIEYTLKGETFRSAIGISSSISDSFHPQYSVATRITLPVLRFFMNNNHIG